MRFKPDVCDVPLKRTQQELAFGLAPALAIAAMQVCVCARTHTGVTCSFISILMESLQWL